MKAVEKRIAGRLLAAGELSESDLERALVDYDGHVPIQDILVDRGFVSARSACRAMAEVNGMQFIELADLPCSPAATKLLTYEQAWRLMVLPIWLEKDCLTIAMAEPNNVLAVDELRLKVKCPVVALIAERSDLVAAMDKYYPNQAPTQFTLPARSSSGQVRRFAGSPPMESDRMPTEPVGMEPTHMDDTGDGPVSRDSFHGAKTQYEVPRLETPPAVDDDSPEAVAYHKEYQRRVRLMRSSGEVPLDPEHMETHFEGSSSDALRRLETERAERGAYEEAPPPLPDTSELPASIVYLHRLLDEGIERHADELELTPMPGSVRVRLRFRGIWEEALPYQPDQHQAVINRLRLMAGLELKAHDVSLDHRFLLPTRRGQYLCHLFLEASTTGERAVVRFTDSTPLLGDPLLDVGLPREIGGRLNMRLSGNGGGLLLVSAPSQRSLNQFYASIVRVLSQNGRRDVLSLERPPIRRLPGITSINCPTEEVLLASLANASFMNPDVLGVSSVESGTVLNRVLNVAVRGTSSVACLTAPDAAAAHGCFRAAGLDAANVMRGVAGHLHFNEVAKLCQHCHREIADRATLPAWARMLEATFFEAAGCEVCRHTGYRGSVLILQYFEPDPHKADGSLHLVGEEGHDLLAFSLAGEIDPREHSM